MSDLNDPRVLFAAERTLLSWNRTSISLMAFGFVVERFGLFLELLGRQEASIFQRHFSFVVGLSFILLAALLAAYSAVQHQRVLRTLRPAEIPERYDLKIGMILNVVIACLGFILSLYLFHGFM